MAAGKLSIGRTTCSCQSLSQPEHCQPPAIKRLPLQNLWRTLGLSPNDGNRTRLNGDMGGTYQKLLGRQLEQAAWAPLKLQGRLCWQALPWAALQAPWAAAHSPCMTWVSGTVVGSIVDRSGNAATTTWHPSGLPGCRSLHQSKEAS